MTKVICSECKDEFDPVALPLLTVYGKESPIICPNCGKEIKHSTEKVGYLLPDLM